MRGRFGANSSQPTTTARAKTQPPRCHSCLGPEWSLGKPALGDGPCDPPPQALLPSAPSAAVIKRYPEGRLTDVFPSVLLLASTVELWGQPMTIEPRLRSPRGGLFWLVSWELTRCCMCLAHSPARHFPWAGNWTVFLL